MLTPDHTSLLTDPNDIVYVKATIADANNRVVTSAANPVTFSVTGPGTIVAVDSGSVNAESFRGNQRMAFQGLCFALIQATGGRDHGQRDNREVDGGDGDDQRIGGNVRAVLGDLRLREEARGAAGTRALAGVRARARVRFRARVRVQ